MRLKQLLLCTLLLVLVRSIQYTSDYTCQHDGYSAPDGTCHCTELYGSQERSSKKDCSQIQCVNSGVLSPFEDDPNQRCSCPPGFLGLHCEPVQCVPGDVRSFDEASHSRDVSIIITYNTEFQKQFTEKDKGPPIEKTICNAVYAQDGVDPTSRVHFYVMQQDILTDKDDCEFDFNYILQSCDPDEHDKDKVNCSPRLTTDYISKALDQMGEDSRLLVISNMGIDDFNTTEGIQGIEAIRKKAISMRIQMHSLVISPREPNDNKVYFNDGFKTLRDLSESTLGFFINPFDGSGGQKFSTDGITEILKGMMKVFFDYVVVDRITTTEDSCRTAADYTVFRVMQADENDFWLTVISSKPNYNIYNTDWIGGPGTPVKNISAGYFNAYTLKASPKDVLSFKPFSTYGKSAKCVPSTVLVLARSGHLARFAITNSDDYDATSPYAIEGEKNTLVGHFKQHYHEENLDKLHLEFSSSTDTPFSMNLDPVPSPRDCQYNARFGEVSCNDGDDTFIRVRDNQDGAAITVQNLYCTQKDSAQALSSHFLHLAQDESPAPVCNTSPVIVKKDGRALIISAHATQKIYELFNGNKNSAIRYLNDLNDLEIYDQYILNIFNGVQQTNAKVISNSDFGYADFKNEMMTEWHQYLPIPDPGDPPSPVDPNEPEPFYFDKECSADVSAVFPLEDLTNRFTNARPNSDIIFIYDRKIDISIEDARDVVKDAYTRRLRLIVLLLACEGGDFNDSNALKNWQSIASRTGGFAVHFKEPSDLNDFLKDYVDWVQGQTAAAIDNMEKDVASWMKPVTSTPFKVNKDGQYTVIVNSVPSVGEVTLSNGFKLVNPTSLGNSITKFDYTADKDDTLTVIAAPVQYFFYASIRVLDLNGDYATIGFSKSKDVPCLEKEYPDFNPQDPQYPATTATADAVTMTLYDGTGTPFRSSTADGDDGTFEIDYNWRCNDNQTQFYVSSDVTTADSSYTRVFITTCIGESDGAACINGQQKPDNKDVCVCPHDYTGDFCEIPVCQNGGEVTVSLECQCKAAYSGFFCENYDGCTEEKDFMPDFKSIASTVIFVVERSKEVTDKLKLIDDETFDNIRAAQYIIVQYGNETEADVMVSTTDKTSLVKFLKEDITAIDLTKIGDSPTSEEYFDAIPAIESALRTQVTGSAQLFWFAETDKSDYFVETLFDAIAKQRVSITALFTRTLLDQPTDADVASSTATPVTSVIHPVQLAGGSVFYYGDDGTNYGHFFAKYIAELLQFQSTFEFRPNVLSTSIECNAIHVVNIDQSTAKLFVAANGADEITISSSEIDPTFEPDVPGGKVFAFKGKKNVYNGAGEVTITIKGQNKDKYCSSTVTAFNQNQVGYGFMKDDTDSKLMVKTGKGQHLLVTYWTAESVVDTPTPTAIVTPISLTDGFGNSTELYATVRSKCSYSLSVPIDCSDGVDALGVTVTNWVIPSGGGTALKVDKYISVLCPDGTCEHGNTTAYGCDCEPFWGGDYCTELLCKNGDIEGDVCECYTGYTGDNCEERIDPADRAGVAFLFIQDVCGADEGLKDKAQSVLDNYMGLLTKGENVYLGTNNPDNSEAVLVATRADLNTAMTANRGPAGAPVQCSASIGATIDSYYLKLRKPSSTSSVWLKAAADPPVGKARVAHVTTVAVDSDAGSYLGILSADYIVNMEFIGITEKNDYFVGEDSFKIFPGDFTQTYDPDVALFDLVNTFGSDVPATTPKPADYPRCIQNIQAAFAFHTDISSVPRMTELRSKAQKVIQSVTKYFSIPDVKNIDQDDDTCEFDRSELEDKTQFYGSIYANSSGIGVPTFCMSNMNTYPGTITTADYKQADQVTLQSVIDSYTKWYNTQQKMTCHCFDYANPNTTAIIMWTPLSPTSLDKTPVSFADFDKLYPKGFNHLVMPMGFKYEDSPLWRSLVPNRELWTDDASIKEADDIIQQIWTITCRMAGHIEEGQTAEPMNPYAPRTKTGGDNQKDDGDVTDETPTEDSPLPR